MPATKEKKAAKSSPAVEALRYAEKKAATEPKWIEFWNDLFGIGGKLSELFPEESAREAFTKSPECAEIMALAAKLSPPSPTAEASGKFNVRLPRSLHAALVAEADSEGTSLNQLVVAKLSVQLKHATGIAK